MAKKPEDTGVVLALVERFEKQRLPRARELKERVDRGELLNDLDMAFLNQVFEDAQHVKRVVQKHPEWAALAASAIALYRDITARALENERAVASGKR